VEVDLKGANTVTRKHTQLFILIHIRRAAPAATACDAGGTSATARRLYREFDY